MVASASASGVAASPQRLADLAYEGLRDRLVTLAIAPGSPISEEAMTRELQVGRTPVREAIRRLALENLVVVFPRRGTFAADINITDLAHISEIRIELEGLAARRAAERLTRAQRGELDDLLRDLACTLAAGDEGALMRLDARVHRFVYRCARNPYLQETAERHLNLSLRMWHLVLDRVREVVASIDEHRLLLDAIRSGDGNRACEVARRHVVTFEREIRALL